MEEKTDIEFEFEVKKRKYLSELSDFFLKYNISLPDYLKLIKEKDLYKIVEPKNEHEFEVANKCLEITRSIKEYSASKASTGGKDLDSNLAETFYYLVFCVVHNKSYKTVAQAYLGEIFSNGVLYGQYLADQDSFDMQDFLTRMAIKSNAKTEAGVISEVISFLKNLILITVKTTISAKKGKKPVMKKLGENLKNTKSGSERYVATHEFVLEFLKDREEYQNDVESFAMTFRKNYGLK